MGGPPRPQPQRLSARPLRPTPEPLEDRTLLAPFGFLTEFPIPTRAGQPAGTTSNPWAITLGPDKNLWFTEQDPTYGNRIGRITPAGALTEYGTSQGLSGYVFPNGITAD